MNYRIMCEGEEHSLWCEKNNLHERDIDKEVETARERFPCATIGVKKEEASMPIEHWIQV